MYRIEFKLSMPGRGSWNGGWSGSEKNYTITKSVSNKYAEKLGLIANDTQSWGYSWSDGWRANVNARILQKGERAKKSDGFCGYNWMVDDILSYNEIRGK